jgi:hypothetical protein
MPLSITEKNLNFLSVTFTATVDNVYNSSDEKVREWGEGERLLFCNMFLFSFKE